MRILRTTSPVVPVPRGELEATVSFYERLFDEPARGRFRNPDLGLDIVLVGNALILGGTEAALSRRRQMRATFVVDSLAQWHQAVVASGAQIVEPPADGPFQGDRPIGRYMFALHPDGGMYEYFEPLG